MLENGDHSVKSLLVAEFSQSKSRAILVEKTADAFRFVGHASNPTTLGAPHNDFSIGWLDLLLQLGHQVGRSLSHDHRLLSPRTPQGDGVDAFLVCSTLGDPIRVALIDTGITPTSTAINGALRRTHVRIMHDTAPAGRKDQGWDDALAERLSAFRPEKVIIVLDGNTAHAAPRVIELLQRVGASLAPLDAVFNGPPNTLTRTNGLFVPPTKTRAVVADEAELEEIATQIERDMASLWNKRTNRDGIRDILSDGDAEPITRPASTNRATSMIAKESCAATLCIAVDEGSDMHLASGEDVSQIALPRLDLRSGVTAFTSHDLAEARHWLPFECTADNMLTWTLNRSIRPWVISLDTQDIRFEQALARRIFHNLAQALIAGGQKSVSEAEHVVLSGQLGRWRDPAGAVLAVLDGLDHVPKSGMVELAMDDDGLIAAVGAMSADYRNAARDVLHHDALSAMGSAIVMSGTIKSGATACEVTIEREDENQEVVTVEGGEIHAFPLTAGQFATVSVKPARKVAVGTHPTGETVVFGDKRPVVGGQLGIVIDARGRPLASAPADRDPERVRRWLQSIGSQLPVIT